MPISGTLMLSNQIHAVARPQGHRDNPGQYIRYDLKADKADPGYPKPINSETWPGIPWTDGIDAAANWRNGKAYFFRGDACVRFDVKADRADPGYPKAINSETWPGLSGSLLLLSANVEDSPPTQIQFAKGAYRSTWSGVIRDGNRKFKLRLA